MTGDEKEVPAGHVRNDDSDIRLGAGASGNKAVDNHFDRNQIGISPWIDGGTGNTFTGNTANNNALWGIENHTSGGTGDAGTNNNYSNNTCTENGSGDSSPYGLCWWGLVDGRGDLG